MPHKAVYTMLALSMVGAAAAQNTSNAVVLSAPSQPPAGQNTIDSSFMSYSIEFNYMLDYAGNSSNPNIFSINMLENLNSLAGSYPYIRVGGTTQNRNYYYRNQTNALNQTFSRPWDDQPSRLSTGPKWFESFQQFPKSIKYLYGLNFYNGTEGSANTLTQGLDAFIAIGENLYAFEIGNEVNGWAGTSRRSPGWTIFDYIREWKDASSAIRDVIRQQPGYESATPYFQGCALGMGESDMLRSVADHDYMGANCAGEPVPTLKDNLLNHHHMTSLMYWHELLGNQTAALGIPYALGETNSISCQGTANVSDVFGAALWSIDYVLYVAGLNINRMYFHMGSVYRYAPWQPTTINGTAPFAKPLYYGNLFTAQALSGGNKQVVSLLNETRLTAYGMYEAGQLRSVAVINLNMFNTTQAIEERATQGFALPETVDWTAATARRLTARGVDAKSRVTFAGRYVDEQGVLVGDEKIENVEDGLVVVGAGEAVLVSLS